MPTEDFEQAQYLSAQVEQARQRAVLAASDAGAARDDARSAEQQARDYARGVSQVVDGAETARDEAQAAADRAEAPTDSMVATLATNPVSLTRAAVDQATGDMITTEGSTTQTAGDARWVTNEGADNTVAEALGKKQSQSATAMLEVIAKESTTAVGLISADEKVRAFGKAATGLDANDLPPGRWYNNSVSTVTADLHWPFPGSSTIIDQQPSSSVGMTQTARALVSNRVADRYRGSTGVWSEWQERIRQADLDNYTPEFVGGETRSYQPTMLNPSLVGGAIRLTRCGNMMEAAGIITTIPGGNVTGVAFAQLPPDAMPLTAGTAAGQRWFSQFATAGKTYLLYINSAGRLSINNLTAAAAGSNIYVSASWAVEPASKYGFDRICARMIAGQDYTRTLTTPAGATFNVMAPHGGEVEPGTSELALAIKNGITTDVTSWYEWDFLNPNVLGTSSFNIAHEVGNHSAGYKGVKFDDTALIDHLLTVDDCIGIHGCWDGTGDENGVGGNGRPPGAISFIGGDNRTLALIISAHLRAAGFRVWDDPATFPGLTGLSKNQIHNTAKNNGVQIELSETQRANFFTGNYLVRANRATTTPAFTAYYSAVVAAITEYRSA